mmetsp:Transcript_29295/g.65979  ORF Transcript_29295/g.65979 Transcript_29295/m.65979 type:complete len:447 (-) Transcript_29295:319-1659(-)
MSLQKTMWQGRWVIRFFVLSLGCSFMLILERLIRERSAFKDHPLFAQLADTLPNARHVWNTWNVAGVNDHLSWIFSQAAAYPVTHFGMDALRTNGSWQELCRMDSDQDGLTNGVELGDPCCRWLPGTGAAADFEISRNLEYRRWQISHPGQTSQRRPRVHSYPESCHQEYNEEQYHAIFRDFYFSRLQDEKEEVPWSVMAVVKMTAFACMILQLGLWFAFDGLGDDLFRWNAPLPPGRRTLLIAASFLYMDFTSGIIHLILDYAPSFLPVLGGLAGGFRYHHEDPTAICRISWFEYASHTHLLAVVVLFVLRLGPTSRGLRYFWAWGLVWSHLFQSAHRWTHFQPEQLSWWKSALQSMLVLSHQRHMEHHQDLEKQFTILSGHTDLLLDPLVKHIMPAAYYDYWCVFGVLWFFWPIFLDMRLLSENTVAKTSKLSWVLHGEAHDKV